MKPVTIFFAVLLAFAALILFCSCSLPDEVRETEIAAIVAVQAAKENHPIIIDTLINEQVRLRDSFAFEQMSAAVKSETRPTPEKTIAQMAEFIEKMKMRRKELGDFADKLKEQNAAAIALELLMPGRRALQEIDETGRMLRELLIEVEK